jgi:hypothetical protein
MLYHTHELTEYSIIRLVKVGGFGEGNVFAAGGYIQPDLALRSFF